MSVVRRLTRPLSILVLVALAFPAVTAECRTLAAGRGDTMPCCKKQLASTPGFDAGCCNVRESMPAPERLPSAPAAQKQSGVVERSAAAALSATLVERPTAIPAPLDDLLKHQSNPLYLRLSVIRR